MPRPLAFLTLLPALVALAANPEDGFSPIFDGRSLQGWHTPDPSYWSVEDGAIVGQITRQHPCTTNQYLVWTGGDLADFELKLESRLNGEGAINNGFQFRSRVLPDHDVCGYQMDNNLQTPWLARLYDEYGRHTLAWRGERAVFNPQGQRTVSKLDHADAPAWFRLEDWHEYHLACVGPRLTLRIDGRLAAEVEDQDPRRRELQGALALQLHSGPPTVVQFRNLRLKILQPATSPPQPPPTPQDAQRQSLLHRALAWWPLDAGGHGAQPPLRHHPAFDQFELNVRAAGPGARPHANVVLLHGAHFDAGPDLHPGPAALTLYLRARDPQGAWNASLFAKGGRHDQLHFNLSGADLPHSPGPDIAFQIRTERGLAQVSFPISQVNPTAWIDLVARYDGQHADLFANGRRLARTPWTGSLATNREPLLIGAETDLGKVVRPFHGELEEAALWSIPLSDDDIRHLSRAP